MKYFAVDYIGGGPFKFHGAPVAVVGFETRQQRDDWLAQKRTRKEVSKKQYVIDFNGRNVCMARAAISAAEYRVAPGTAEPMELIGEYNDSL